MVIGESLNKCNYVKAGVRIIRVIDVFLFGGKGEGICFVYIVKIRTLFFFSFLLNNKKLLIIIKIEII